MYRYLSFVLRSVGAPDLAACALWISFLAMFVVISPKMTTSSQGLYNKSMQSLIHDLQQNKFTTLYETEGVNYLGLFGSFARGEETPESDVDLLVDFNETKSLFDLARLKISLQENLGKKVDISLRGSLKKSLEPYILQDLTTVYEQN